jgi:predicted nucleic-acid-binding protein
MRTFALALPALCQSARVLSPDYKILSGEIADAIRRLVDAANSWLTGERCKLELAMLQPGGDFADGIIAYEGKWLGAEVFTSFDKKALALMDAQGQSARLLS